MKRIRYWPLLAFAVLAACSPAPGETPAPLPQPTPLPQDERLTAPEVARDVQLNNQAEQEMAAELSSCSDELGAEAAKLLVDQCLAISPATRPPCHVQNSCDMIRDEIRRGCGFGDAASNPEFCGDYL